MPLPLAIPVDQRVELESKLARRLSQRPTRIELEQRNILPGEFPLCVREFVKGQIYASKLLCVPTVIASSHV